jgi:hypothetical protein
MVSIALVIGVKRCRAAMIDCQDPSLLSYRFAALPLKVFTGLTWTNDGTLQCTSESLRLVWKVINCVRILSGAFRQVFQWREILGQASASQQAVIERIDTLPSRRETLEALSQVLAKECDGLSLSIAGHFL